MLDAIQLSKMRLPTTEFNASNYTTIGDYQIGKHLGVGAYASVKQAIHKPTGMLTAIKIYEKFKLNDPQRKKALIKEINVLKKLQ